MIDSTCRTTAKEKKLSQSRYTFTIENATVKINAKIDEMEKESYRLVTMSFWGTERAVLVFKKGLKGSLL